MSSNVERPTVQMRPLRKRPLSTLVVQERDLPRSPAKLTGWRKAQLMDLYMRLLEESHRVSRLLRSGTFDEGCRAAVRANGSSGWSAS